MTAQAISFPAGARVQHLSDGRLHLHHGPIDLIVQAWGNPLAVRQATKRAIARFATILEELCEELPDLRSETGSVSGETARRMADAVAPFKPAFITPMAAVAGAVADTLIEFFAVEGIGRAYINNGGDIALHLADGQALTCAIAAQPGFPDRLNIPACSKVRGIATSGWRGRSFSLGIADSVTVLAHSAAMADAAATMIANQVDLPGHPAVQRRPACELQLDNDLGSRPVTVSVGGLTTSDRAKALDRGLAYAQQLMARELIEGAALFLQDDVRLTGFPTLNSAELTHV